ncbi:hypothetical protein Rhopal_000497-T1 [Rhodotorula paludigena]|uniref:DUF7702 domain-containing protein n=1 Tax=Rhodotorula paludigena TaxID=86838 RepID=A0AAV5GB72_9BASI|nr:hypothetical protein Rhopal_000497-T1 [Rhodotorula paludigena]
MDSVASSLPKGFSLVGGIPLKSQDFAASIIFIVAFGLLIPLAFWRIIHKPTRSTVLIRPCVVLVARIATYAIRAVEANGNYAEGLFIAEQILLLLGLLPLCEPLISLLKFHVRRNWIPTPENVRDKSILGRVLWLLETALLVGIILGVVAGSKTSDAMSDPDELSSLKSYRYGISGLTLFVIVTAPIVAGFCTFQEGLPRQPLAFLVCCGAILLIPSIYKLDITLHPPSSFSASSKATFYCLSALPEWILVTVYLGVDLESLFAVKEGQWKERVAKKMRKGKWTGPYVARDEFEMHETRADGVQRTAWEDKV